MADEVTAGASAATRREGGLDDDAVRQKLFEVTQVFTPGAPVTRADLFAKRGDRMEDLVEVIGQRGQHAVVYGERGVGKTSFVTVMADVYSKVFLSGRVTCASGEDFSTIMRHLFGSILVDTEKPEAGFTLRTKHQLAPATALINESEISPDGVRRALAALSSQEAVVVLVDEFDRITDSATQRKFADTLKSLSDYVVNATVVLVGVADTVVELIAEHESVSRALTEIHMPRMEPDELGETIDRALASLGMQIELDAKARIIGLSRGLPSYTHRLGLYAAKEAIRERRYKIILADIEVCIRETIDKVQEYVSSMYHKATWSSRRTNYEQVLLACALAPVDEKGYFATTDVRTPLSMLMKKNYDIPYFISNLNQLASPERGSVLQKTGGARTFRYRFRDPLLQPYVILRGINKGTIDFDTILSASS
jgi:energy-coupling factor transporter ATP-binding protein EcfA2